MAPQDNGEVELLAVLQDTLPPPCAGAISVINHWYGRDDIPIGAYKGSGLSLVPYGRHSNTDANGAAPGHHNALRTRRTSAADSPTSYALRTGGIAAADVRRESRAQLPLARPEQLASAQRRRRRTPVSVYQTEPSAQP